MSTSAASAGPIPYDVQLPEAGLGWEKVGPLFERYSVSLVGLVDEQWIRTYQRIAAATPNLTRFRLEPETRTVSFTCRATDGPVEVMTVLKILGGMLERVNREASFDAASLDPEPRPIRSRPGAGASEARSAPTPLRSKR